MDCRNRAPSHYTHRTSVPLKKILRRPLRMAHAGKDGLCTSPAGMIKTSERPFPLFKTPEPELKELDGNAPCTQQSTAGAGGCSFLTQRRPLPAGSWLLHWFFKLNQTTWEPTIQQIGPWQSPTKLPGCEGRDIQCKKLQSSIHFHVYVSHLVSTNRWEQDVSC